MDEDLEAPAETMDVPGDLVIAPDKEVRHRKKQFYKVLRRQMEFYFSDANLTKNRFMGKKVLEDPNVDLSLFLKFNKIRALTMNTSDIAKALRKSDLLALTEDGTKVYRTTPIGDKKNEDDCTIYVENLPPEAEHEWLRSVFLPFGNVPYISIPKYTVSRMNKGFAFVEFDTVESANQALEAFGAMGCRIPTQILPDQLCSNASNKEFDTEQLTNEENPGVKSEDIFPDAESKVEVQMEVKEDVLEKDENCAGVKREKRRRSKQKSVDVEPGASEDVLVKKVKDLSTERDKVENEEPPVTKRKKTGEEEENVECQEIEEKKKKKVKKDSECREDQSSDKVDNEEVKNRKKTGEEDENVECEEIEEKKKKKVKKDSECREDQSSDKVDNEEVKKRKKTGEEDENVECEEIEEKKKKKVKKDLECREDQSQDEVFEEDAREDGDEKENEEERKKKKSRRHKKKTKKEEQDGDPRRNLRILPKAEWKRLRNKYLSLQKSKMMNLKQHLARSRWGNNYSQEPRDYYHYGSQRQEEAEKEAGEEKPEKPVVKPKKQFTFIPGVIVHVRLDEPVSDVKAFKASARTHAEVLYVDLEEGASDAHIRCGSADAAKRLASERHWRTVQVLTGEEETTYWQKITRDRDQKLGGTVVVGRKKGMRGRDKLLKKAEKALGKHIRFDEHE